VTRRPANQDEFTGPILSGRVDTPTRRELRRSKKRRRRASERILRGLIISLALVVVVAGLGYGYVRFQWGKIHSVRCATCVAVASGRPYNLLVVGSDSRSGETTAQALQFGGTTTVSGQRSDTIKIVHLDPTTGTASTLSIPRDTFVTLSGMKPGTGLATESKINTSFDNGQDALIQTIQNTFGIPISHFILINFSGLQDAVDALGGISLNFPDPVRDQKCDNAGCHNMSGLAVSTAGCQHVSGAEALDLSRSRYFQYFAGGAWHSDPTSDIGRIKRQNVIIAAAVNKASSTYNPLRVNSLLNSVGHDFTKDDALTVTDMLSLAERYHAFSGSSLTSYTLPTVPADSSTAGSVELVQQALAGPLIAQFLGGSPGTVSTPPLNAYGHPMAVPTSGAMSGSSPGRRSSLRTTSARGVTLGFQTAAAATAPATVPTVDPPYDPTPC
jgi:LCP family protein required for cell wall assembly